MCTTTLATLRWTNISPGSRPDDLVGRHAAVGAADPQVLGDCCCESAEKNSGSLRADALGPRAVVVEQMPEISHSGRSRAVVDPVTLHGLAAVREVFLRFENASAARNRSRRCDVRARAGDEHACEPEFSGACQRLPQYRMAEAPAAASGRMP